MAAKTNLVNNDFPDFECNISKPAIPQNQIFLQIEIEKKKKPHNFARTKSQKENRRNIHKYQFPFHFQQISSNHKLIQMQHSIAKQSTRNPEKKKKQRLNFRQCKNKKREKNEPSHQDGSSPHQWKRIRLNQPWPQLSLCLKAPHRLSLSKKNSLSVCFLREHRPFASLAYIPSDSLSLKFMTLSLSLTKKEKRKKKNYPTAKHHRRYVRPSVPTELLLPLVNILFYRRLYIGIKSLLVPTFSCDFHFSS